MWDMIRQNGKYIVLKPEYNSAKYVPYTGSSTSNSSSDTKLGDETVAAEEVVSTETSAGTNWDKILDEYETVCDKAVKLAKKAQAGDISAVTEYAELAEKATSLQNKLQNAEADLTPAQVARLSKIAAKLTSSMM